MPCSGYEPIAPVMNLVRQIALQPPHSGNRLGIRTVVDLGVGMGQWGMLLRTYLDYYYGRFQPKDFQLTLVGVEGFPGYRCPTWDLYTTVKEMNILEFVPGMPKTDLVTMFEVLEHLTKDEGRRTLFKLKERSRHLMFSYFNGPQDAVYGNPLEIHRAQWSYDELQEIFPDLEFICGDIAMGSFVYAKGDA